MDLVTRLGLGRTLRVSTVPHTSPAASDLKQDFTLLKPSDMSEADVLLMDVNCEHVESAFRFLSRAGVSNAVLACVEGVEALQVAGGSVPML